MAKEIITAGLEETSKWTVLKRKIWNRSAMLMLYICSAITLITLVFIIGYIVLRGMNCLSWDLVTSQSSYLHKSIGILPNILNTLYIIIVAMSIVIPLGTGAAVYLTEYASSKVLVRIIEFAAEALTGIPSIIFGLAGMVLFTDMMGLQQGILAGGLTLVMMILPLIMRTTQESLKAIPQMYREGAMALGAGKWRTIRTVVLPNALDGIITGSILAIGRVIGESAALLFTAGYGLVIRDFFSALDSSSATLTVALYIYASERGEMEVAFSIALILLGITMIINMLAKYTAATVKRN